MTSRRNFRGTTSRDTNESRNTRLTERRGNSDVGTGYHPVDRDRAVQYGNDVQNLFAGLRRNKDINKAFDIIQREKNHLLKEGNIRGKHAEIYGILDDLQDAVLYEKQEDIADIVSSVRRSSKTSPLVRSSLDSIIQNMQQYNNRRQIRETRRTQTQPEQGSSRGDQAAERQRYLTEYVEEPIRTRSNISMSETAWIARGPRSSHDMNKRGTYVIHEELNYVIRIDRAEARTTSQYLEQLLEIMNKAAPNSAPSRNAMQIRIGRLWKPTIRVRDDSIGEGWRTSIVK